MELFRTSRELLKGGPYPLGHKGYDKLFLLAHLVRTESTHYYFIVLPITPTVRLDERLVLDVPTVSSVAENRFYSLFSSNVLLRIEGYGYPVLKRDSGAPVYPEHYTCSAGRCEQSPLNTALAELNQEIAVIVSNQDTGEIRLLGYGTQEAAQAGKAHKEKALGKFLPELLVAPLTWENGPDCYELWLGSCDQCVSTNEILVERVEKSFATVIYDKETNAYEICFQAAVSLPEGWQVDQVMDGENFGREAGFITELSSLKGKPCVPALNGLIEREKF